MGNFIIYDNDHIIKNLIVCESKELAEELTGYNAKEYSTEEKNIHTWWVWDEQEQDFVFPESGEPEGFNPAADPE